MENIDLKMIWRNAHLQNKGKISEGINIDEIIKMNHCNTISKIISDIKLRVFLYSMLLSIFGGLMIYAIGYLGINFSMSSIIPFTLVGLFLLISTTTEMIRLIVYSQNADNLPLKKSQNYFHRKLNRLITIDFFSYMIFLYSLAIIVIREYLQDISGFKNLSGINRSQTTIMAIFILILLLTPWIMKYQNNRRYRKIDSSLNNSTDQLNDEF